MLGKLILAAAFFLFQNAVNDCNSCIVVAQTQVTIQNPSFETYNTLDHSTGNGQWNYGPIPSWTISGSGGAGSIKPNSTPYPSGVPDGTVIAWSNGSTISQDLGVTAQANTSYTLSVYVGHIATFDATFTVTLSAGTTTLCTSTNSNTTIPNGTFALEGCTYSGSPTPPSGDLIISLASAGVQNDFDKVSLTYAPASHQASLTWTDSLNPSGTTYNVYRSNGATWNPVLLANVPTLSYTDTTIVPNQSYVYKVTAVLNGVESADGQFISVTLGLQ